MASTSRIVLTSTYCVDFSRGLLTWTSHVDFLRRLLASTYHVDFLRWLLASSHMDFSRGQQGLGAMMQARAVQAE